MTDTSQTDAAETTTAETQTETAGRTFTQSDVDKIVGERLARQKDTHYADYDDLKSKAQRLQELEDANKSEQQKLTDRIAELETTLKTKDSEVTMALREAVAAAKGVPAKNITGSTREEMEASADELVQWRGVDKKKTSLRSGASGGDATTAKERAAMALRGVRDR